jgi:hypothetical protein
MHGRCCSAAIFTLDRVAVATCSCYSKDLARHAPVHGDGTLELGELCGVLSGRQAHRQRVDQLHREVMGCADGRGGEYQGRSDGHDWRLREEGLTCGVWAMRRSAR